MTSWQLLRIHATRNFTYPPSLSTFRSPSEPTGILEYWNKYIYLYFFISIYLVRYSLEPYFANSFQL
jgi:hypothetical protein